MSSGEKPVLRQLITYHSISKLRAKIIYTPTLKVNGNKCVVALKHVEQYPFKTKFLGIYLSMLVEKGFTVQVKFDVRIVPYHPTIAGTIVKTCLTPVTLGGIINEHGYALIDLDSLFDPLEGYLNFEKDTLSMCLRIEASKPKPLPTDQIPTLYLVPEYFRPKVDEHGVRIKNKKCKSKRNMKMETVAEDMIFSNDK